MVSLKSFLKRNRPDKAAILLYDATCRFCEASSRRALSFVPAGAMQREDINEPTVQKQYSITPQAAQREMHLVNPDGEVTHGGEAVRDILKLSAWLWPLAFLWQIPGFGWVAQRVYLWIADHRYLFMGKQAAESGADCGDGACSIHLGRPTAALQPEHKGIGS